MTGAHKKYTAYADLVRIAAALPEMNNTLGKYARVRSQPDFVSLHLSGVHLMTSDTPTSELVRVYPGDIMTFMWKSTDFDTDLHVMEEVLKFFGLTLIFVGDTRVKLTTYKDAQAEYYRGLQYDMGRGVFIDPLPPILSTIRPDVVAQWNEMSSEYRIRLKTLVRLMDHSGFEHLKPWEHGAPLITAENIKFQSVTDEIIAFFDDPRDVDRYFIRHSMRLRREFGCFDARE